mmetsp:Transcript_10567/g.7899  ORF Transcript_10567/g.7899 Transcript_10567/m.7899 type:complete len:80 (+) Transcript_10567:73-312(+)|eukprot:CAMPEP_0202978790 /NCGR_PEP_ID=MMETSP1396-20130829/85115_1 /ASSEMBLY_ACC=CAM_ASM_000872 /TAXON_ID= /ORGANISM="Pseudokeronopsis sp., Strain Brazil" /LENGTH=79 /DNA_ID=CAMNT_0049717917 /DNA_START=73 /DNA_END=312 /DNA_ORIENTATION=+
MSSDVESLSESSKLKSSSSSSCGGGGKKEEEDRVVSSVGSDEMQRRKRIVLRYPNGSYSHAYKSGEADCWMEVKFSGNG